MKIFRIKRYSAVDLLTGFPRWEYFTAETVQKAREMRDTMYSYDVVYAMAHKKGKLQVYSEDKFRWKWKTVKERVEE